MTTLGKFRHLMQSSTSAGHFCVLAIDHRANLIESLNKYASAPLTDSEFTNFKNDIIHNLTYNATAVLTDPMYGIGQGITNAAISGQIGLLAPLEVTNYHVHPSQRITTFIEHWSVAKIKKVGGSGVKLLLYYHPDDSLAESKRNLVASIIEECAKYDIPFFLEPIAYSLSANTPLTNEELRRVVVESVRTFSEMGADVLKLEFPLNPIEEADESVWFDACCEISSVSKVPWTLLSGGVDYETFRRQSVIACQAGASGVIVGRAVWGEAVKFGEQDRQIFLKTTASQRMKELADICTTYATDWRKKTLTPSLSTNWYINYAE